MLKNINRSKKWSYIIYSVMFLIMLIANILTPIVSDDFSYCFSFAGDRGRIESVGEIFPSLIAHGEGLNGRYAAHFFAHLFLMLPGIIFDIVNSLVFVMQVFIVVRIATYKRECNNLLSVFLFGMLWLCQCQFGQVNLWLDGACNYMWSVFFGFMFVAPYIMYFLYDVHLSLPLLIPYLFIALLSGNFMENVSPAFILIAGLLMLASTFVLKKKIRYEQVLGILFSLTGFIFMMIAPGEWINKVSNGDASSIFINLLVAIGMVAVMVVPLIFFFVLITRVKKDESKKPVFLLSIILMIGAFASNFVMITAAYYALRSSIGSTSLILFSVVFLLSQFEFNFDKKFKIIASLLTAAVSLAMIIGFVDITRTYILISENEEKIIEAKENGESSVAIPNIVPFTKYSGSYRLIYIDTENPDGWPNNVMAKYYGLDFIIGYDE